MTEMPPCRGTCIQGLLTRQHRLSLANNAHTSGRWPDVGGARRLCLSGGHMKAQPAESDYVGVFVHHQMRHLLRWHYRAMFPSRLPKEYLPNSRWRGFR